MDKELVLVLENELNIEHHCFQSLADLINVLSKLDLTEGSVALTEGSVALKKYVRTNLYATNNGCIDFKATKKIIVDSEFNKYRVALC